MVSKITFLFGSGADTDACKSLMSGQGFSEGLLTNKYKKEIDAITGIDATHFQLLYPTSTRTFVQTIAENQTEARKIFGEGVVDEFVKYYMKDTSTDGNADSEKVNFQKDILPKCSQLYKLLNKSRDVDEENDGSYEKGKRKLDMLSEDDAREFFLKNAVFFDSLDEKFNSLRKTPHNSNAKRVINAYMTVFLLLFECLYNKSIDNIEWSYEKIFEKLEKEYDIESEPGNYYQLLRESKLNCNIITTNYTDIVENETESRKVTYLHGRMTWFEDLENLTVFDCRSKTEKEKLLEAVNSNKENVIPFILIPSGVKPLICRKQIEEFADLIKKLDESQYLVVVGYKFNSEDNHINSIIADWLRDDEKKLIYLNYNSNINFNNLRWAKEFSRLEIYEPNTVESLLSFEKITDIHVCRANSRQVFKEILDKLQEA